MAQIHDPQHQPFAVSRKTAAELIDCHVDTIDNMVERGELERVKLTKRKVAITWRSLQKLVGEAAL